MIWREVFTLGALLAPLAGWQALRVLLRRMRVVDPSAVATGLMVVALDLDVFIAAGRDGGWSWTVAVACGVYMGAAIAVVVAGVKGDGRRKS